MAENFPKLMPPPKKTNQKAKHKLTDSRIWGNPKQDKSPKIHAKTYCRQTPENYKENKF